MKILPSKETIIPTAIVALVVILAYGMYQAKKAKVA